MNRSAITSMLVLLSLAGCATPRQRLAKGLENAGLSPRMSVCMADKMVDRLSLTQFRRLQSLSALPKSDVGRLTVEQFLHQARALRDPEILNISANAALLCALHL